ncbi:interleukin-1 receptor family member [Holotrichia oblita]|uniref:Interleukin-1 receptor family member n=1 Tax=Holotrichia oblita TaxID=644536 RepID=A0ACB9TF61_HOLOL|nr:interleukin-1 receptor family member [Holotrichia oblita]
MFLLSERTDLHLERISLLTRLKLKITELTFVKLVNRENPSYRSGITRKRAECGFLKVPTYLPKNPVPLKKILWIFGVLTILTLTVFVIYLRYGLKARVCLKDQFGILEEDDGKINDVLIVYSPNDEEIAVGTMLTILKNHYYYKCCSREFPSDINLWYTNLSETAKRSRRIVAVISPATLNQHWDSRSLYEALKQLHAFNDKLTCVLLKEVPRSEMEIKNSAGETLSSIVRCMNVVHWQRNKEDKFWLSLRLRLPPKRHGDMDIRDNRSINTLRLRNGYGESLDELV